MDRPLPQLGERARTFSRLTPVTIERVILRELSMPLKTPFETSFGREDSHDFVLVEVAARVNGEVLSGWGEAPVMRRPLYNEETVATAWHVLEDFFATFVLGKTFADPMEVAEALRPFRRHYMAKSALEAAVWDVEARALGLPLAKLLGGAKERIPVGVSVGIQKTEADLLRVVEGYLAEGYRRIKVKIKPGYDVEPIATLRKHFGDIPLMADANSAYTLADLPLLKELDAFGLMMIEQPLGHDDIIDHATVQRALATPICLDESIASAEDARKAVELGACRIINIKVPRVGGLTEALRIHDLCLNHGVPVWCGGLLESGIGRAQNIAVTTLPGFTLPGDTSGSSRYWREDIIEPEVTVSVDGYITVPTTPGLGYRPLLNRIEGLTLRRRELA